MIIPSYFQILILFLKLFFSTVGDTRLISIKGFAQGTTYQVKYIAGDSIVTQSHTDSILHEIDLSLSLYNEKSLISKFNTANRSVKMDSHFKRVVEKSLETFKNSGGAFDITVKPLVDAWGFGVKGLKNIPNDSDIKKIVPCIGSGLLKVQGNILVKTRSCVQIDCNGIAQGYSVDFIAEYLIKKDIRNFLVEIGGEIRAMGRNDKNQAWTVGIESPGDGEGNEITRKIIHLTDGAVTTSGNYKKYYLSSDKRYSHLIDPHTGIPSDNGLVSVTVIASDAITADAFDNTFMVMGLDKSFRFLLRRTDLEAYFIYRTASGRYADTATAGFYKFIH